jgi:predicted O-methyltransferase YrrM
MIAGFVSLLEQHPGIARTLRALRYHPPHAVLRTACGKAAWRVAGSSLRTRTPPSLREINASGGRVHVAAAEAARALCDGADERRLAELCAEHAEVMAELERRYLTARLTCPDEWAVEQGTSLLIYLLVRLRRPEVVLETGVANGHSSFLWLRALERNGAGRLHSVDVRDDVGQLLEDRERSRWQLHLLDPARPEREFGALVRRLAPVDLFFHDADHSYLAQRFEYETIRPAMAPGGLLTSDDMQESHAFLEFASRHGLAPHVLVDVRKLIGAAVVP